MIEVKALILFFCGMLIIGLATWKKDAVIKRETYIKAKEPKGHELN